MTIEEPFPLPEQVLTRDNLIEKFEAWEDKDNNRFEQWMPKDAKPDGVLIIRFEDKTGKIRMFAIWVDGGSTELTPFPAEDWKP